MQTEPLPGYLLNLPGFYVDSSAQGTAMDLRVQERIPGLPRTVLKPGESPPAGSLHLSLNQGRRLKPCPGTRYYRCCAYQIAHIGEMCPLGCTYCILQAYFPEKTLRIFAHTEHIFQEIVSFTATGRRLRAGAGEFTDSLVLEPLTGIIEDLAGFLNDKENIRLELKTKTINLSWLKAVSNPKTFLPSWSVNAPGICQREESLCATLEERLITARKCASLGFRVCLHFDPIIYYPDWERGYARTVDMIFDYLRPKDIAYLSLGSFRFMPKLEEILERDHPGSNLTAAEFITGLDGKRRLFRPKRVKMLKNIADRLASHGISEQVYLCMESDEVWRDTLGRSGAKLGLRLEELAFK